MKKFFSLKKSYASFAMVFFLSFLATPFFFAFAQKSEISSEPEAGTISAEAFTQSSAALYFQEGKYEQAIAALEKLLEQYPKDPLLLRYRAIALDQIGRSREAIQILEELLLDYPHHVPTHYFLGQAYARAGQRDKADQAWQFAAKEGQGTPYGIWAQEAIERFGPREKTAPVQRWNILARYGYEYDSNVILKPTDKSVASTADSNAGRQVLDLGVRYRAYSRRDLALDLLYVTRQTIHDDSLNEFNFHSEEFGANFRKRIQIGSRDYVAGFRYDLLLGFLESSLFSVGNRFHLSLESRFTKQTRTVFYDRINIDAFPDNGIEPSKTSRDALRNDIGVTHYWYTSDFRRFLFFRQEINGSAASGSNYDSFGLTSRAGFFTPLIWKLDLDHSWGFQPAFYPHFSSLSVRDSSRRRDLEWDMYIALTYHITPRLGLRGFYRYIGGENQNNLYDYDRQVGGVHLLYDLHF